MQLIDTHCHIHFRDYGLDPEVVLEAARADDVTHLLCVGCTLVDSEDGVEFAAQHDDVWAAIGLHPHEAREYVGNDEALQKFRSLADKPKVVAVGEIGLDYYYKHSSPDEQKQLLRWQLDLAQEHNLPVIFHVREAFADFWKIVDEYPGVRGVVHSFSSGMTDLEQILKRNLYVGLNGIMTFTKDEAQLDAAKAVPLDKLLLETDAPYLTPTPFRGTICQPKHVRVTAEFLSKIRGESLQELAEATTKNALQLFSLDTK